MNTQTAGVWPDEVRLKMIEKSEFYQEPKIYQYGFYDGYQAAKNEPTITTLTIQQALEVWDDACKDLLKDIAQVFLDKSNQAKADTLRDADVFQAVGETIENFPLRDKRTYFLYKFGIDIDKM